MDGTTPRPLAASAKRDQVEALLRDLLIQRGYDPDDESPSVDVDEEDDELADALVLWQQYTNRMRAALGVTAASVIRPPDPNSVGAMLRRRGETPT